MGVPKQGPAGLVYFHSDWRTATGSSQAAVRDTDQERPWTTASPWTTTGGLVVESTAANGRPFPSANYARVRATDPTDSWVEVNLDDSGYIPTPQVGDTIVARFYWRLTLTDAWNDDEETHGMYFGREWGPDGIGFHMRTCTNGGWTLEVVATDAHPGAQRFYATGTGNGPAYGYLCDFQKNYMYRIELLYTRVATDSYRMDVRVYDQDDQTLLFDGSDFTNWPWGDGNSVLDEVTLTIPGAAAAGVSSSFTAGLNGLAFLDREVDFGEMAAVAICSSWCGPYPIPGVEDR